MKIHGAIRCPSCAGALRPVRMRCDDCDLTVSGRFGVNEFAGLGEEDLHFLRIFVLCEGRIRDMESAMGVSYPTIKARLAQLKETLAEATKAPLVGGLKTSNDMPGTATGKRQTLSDAVVPVEAAVVKSSVELKTAAILKDLEAGRQTYAQAMEQLRQIQKDTLS